MTDTQTDIGSGKSLEVRIQEWVEKTGYGLEMRVARSLADAGLYVLQSGAYQDPTSSKHREIDVFVFEPDTFGRSKAGIVVPIECKRSPGSPWVLFSRRQEYSIEDRIARMPATPRGKKLLPRLQGVRDVGALALFEMPDVVGYSLVAAKLGYEDAKRKRNRAYDAVRSVASAAEGWLNQFGKHGKMATDMVAFAWPLLVVEGRLFQSVLDQDGNIEVTEISRGVLAWRRPGSILFLTITTEDGLNDHLDALATSIKRFASLATSALA